MRNRPPRPHVIQLITTLDPGGAEHQLLALVRRLRHRFRFTVAYFKGDGGLRPAFAELGVDVHALGIKRPIDPICLLRLARMIRHLRPDLIATHLFKADAYGAAAAPAPTPVVSHKHNEDLYLLNPLLGAVGRLVATRAGAVISVSAAVARFFIDGAGFPADKMVPILHGIEPIAAASDFRQDERLDGERLIGTVARLTPQKGIATLLAATKLLLERDAVDRCIIVGSGEEDTDLRARARSLGIADRVWFTGRRTDVPAVLRALDVFVLPSLWEGFGIVLLEAMAQECPVVASRVGGIPEVVADGVTGLLVPPGDAAALAAAVERLVGNEGDRSGLVRRASASLASDFSADRMAGETAAVYESVLAAGA